jgi:plastocyanin
MPFVLVLAVACGGKSGGSGGTAVAITASDSACAVAKTTLAAGKTTFRVRNTGSDVTEVYVYTSDNVVVTEKENIGPGTEATFTATMAAGHYQVACKPGMQGDGIRTDIEVTGKGGPAFPAHAETDIEFSAKDFSYSGLDNFAPKVGQSIEFEMANHGPSLHEFEVFGPDGKGMGEVGPTPKGKVGKVTLQFAAAGRYRYQCGIADHAQRGMKGTFTVTAT